MSEVEELKEKIENLRYENAILEFEIISLRRDLKKTHKICSLLIFRRW